MSEQRDEERPVDREVTKQRRWRIKPGKLLLELVVVVALVWLAEWVLTLDAAHGPLPPLQGEMVSGAMDALDGEGAGLVYFWAIWCPVCELQKEEVGAVMADYRHMSVAMQSGGKKEVKQYLEENRMEAAVLNDPAGLNAKRYGVSAVPAAFIFNSQREIVFVTRGYTSEWGLRLRLWLAERL